MLSDRSSAALVLLAAWGVASFAASTSVNPSQQSPAITAAEAEGAAYPRPTEDKKDSTPQVFEVAPGTSERRCTEAKGRWVRSGEFLAGAFDDYYGWLWRQGVSKMSWTPAFAPSGIGRAAEVVDPWTLTIKATRLDAQASVVSTQARTLSRGVLPNGDLTKTVFFSGVGLLLPSPGRWLVVGTAGPNWGCFIFSFTGVESEPKIR